MKITKRDIMEMKFNAIGATIGVIVGYFLVEIIKIIL
jgi:hypothetical protein